MLQTSEQANLPRWRGQPGYFEIWFLCLFEAGSGRAWWLRYTTFAPQPGKPGDARATLWAAAFQPSGPALALKQLHPASAYRAEPGRFGVHIGESELGQGVARGRVEAGGRSIAWDLRFEPAALEALRSPALLHRLPLPTQGAHAHSGVRFSGSVQVDGETHHLQDARGLQYHIHGTRRVEELYWLYCPRFEEDPGANLEAMSLRSTRRLPGGLPGPRAVPVWLQTGQETVDRCGLWASLRNRVEVPAPGQLRFTAEGRTRAIRARAWCDPRTLVGYVYRDPSGFDLHVAQSDVGACEVELLTRVSPRKPWQTAGRYTARSGVALEFHHPEPLPGVRYIPWDGCALPPEAS